MRFDAPSSANTSCDLNWALLASSSAASGPSAMSRRYSPATSSRTRGSLSGVQLPAQLTRPVSGPMSV